MEINEIIASPEFFVLTASEDEVTDLLLNGQYLKILKNITNVRAEFLSMLAQEYEETGNEQLKGIAMLIEKCANTNFEKFKNLKQFKNLKFTNI